ncbi:MAG: DUF4235 domain-containing protein [Acidimicrobiales bacterium]|nr:DUF4235 domain-containing protein [Acidimicrobiales bacterium]
MDDEDVMWSAAAGAAALVGAQLARKALGKAWVRKRGSIPGNPATSDTTWGEALAWAVVSGVGIGVARLLAQRGVALAFERQRGSIPTAAAEKPSA